MKKKIVENEKTLTDDQRNKHQMKLKILIKK